MIDVDHVSVRWGVGASGGASLSFDLEPGLSQSLGEVIVHRSGDGHRVGDRLRLSVVFPQTAAEMLLNHRVACCICYNRKKNGDLVTRRWTWPCELGLELTKSLRFGSSECAAALSYAWALQTLVCRPCDLLQFSPGPNSSNSGVNSRTLKTTYYRWFSWFRTWPGDDWNNLPLVY